MTAEPFDLEDALDPDLIDGCGFCTHVWHDDNPCGGDTWAGICECPSSERA